MLGNKLRADLGKMVPVNWEEVAQYIERLRTSGDRSRYPSGLSELQEVEFQDKLLADMSLPSATGAITNEVAVDIIDEAVSWGLLRSINYTLTDRGAAMLYLWSVSKSSHPLLLDSALRHACTYWYFDADGDALRYTYGNVPPGPVKRLELGEALGDGIAVLLSNSQTARSLDRRSRLRLKELLKAIKFPKGESSGSGRAVYQQATMRGEHPTDLGLVAKRDRFGYVYEIPATGCLQLLTTDIDEFLERRFAHAYLGVTFEATPDESAIQDTVWPLIIKAYSILRNPLGYASYDDVALLVQVLSAAEGLCCEIAAIKTVVSDPKATYRVRLGVGRSGKPQFLKVDDVPV